MASGSPYWLDQPSRTYPPLAGDERVDVAVVGGGVSGLSCARVLASAGLRVRVLEARRVGSGASGRNGGFALRGGALPYHRQRLPDLWRLTEEALARVEGLAGDACRRTGSLRVAASEEELVDVHAEHDALAQDGFAVERVEPDELPPLLRPHFLGGIRHPGDGVLEPGRWARRLAALTRDAGAALAEETRATAVDGTSVHTDFGTVAADHVVVATDGYTHGLVPELDAAVEPARAQVLATEPLGERHFDCPVYGRHGFDYWKQTPDGRIVIGGWRDTEIEAEAAREEATTDAIQERIEAFLERLLGRRPAVTHRWSGLLGFTEDALPLAGPLRDGVWCALGYSGHGNVLALACGEGVGAAILGRPDERFAPLSPGRTRAARPPA